MDQGEKWDTRKDSHLIMTRDVSFQNSKIQSY